MTTDIKLLAAREAAADRAVTPELAAMVLAGQYDDKAPILDALAAIETYDRMLREQAVPVWYALEEHGDYDWMFYRTKTEADEAAAEYGGSTDRPTPIPLYLAPLPPAPETASKATERYFHVEFKPGKALDDQQVDQIKGALQRLKDILIPPETAE